MGRRNQLAKIDEEDSDYSTRVSVHTGHLLSIDKPDLNNTGQVEIAIKNYFTLCQEDKVKPTISGLAMSLGVNRKTLLKYASGETRVNNREAIATALQTIEVFDETMLKQGLMPALAGIFIFKNNYGYTDKTEVVTGTDELSDEEIAERYLKKHEVVADIKPQ